MFERPSADSVGSHGESPSLFEKFAKSQIFLISPKIGL